MPGGAVVRFRKALATMAVALRIVFDHGLRKDHCFPFAPVWYVSDVALNVYQFQSAREKLFLRLCRKLPDAY